MCRRLRRSIPGHEWTQFHHPLVESVKGLKALQKPLAGVNSSEPPGAAESVAGGDMTTLNGLSGVAATAMQARAHMTGQRDDRGYRFHIRLVMVSDYLARRYARTGECLAKKRLRTGPIAFVPQEHINDLPMLIDRAIRVTRFSVK